jgi:hypothetical protein
MFEVLDIHGEVIAVFGKKRGTAFVIDERKLKTAKGYQAPKPYHWIVYLFFPLLLPIDLWIRKRFH